MPRAETPLAGNPTIIDDLTGAFFAFWERAAGRRLAEQRRLWDEEYEAPHRELFAASGGRHGGPDEIAAAFGRYQQELPRLRRSVPRIKTSIATLASKLDALFETAATVRWVVLVGAYHSDGWLAYVDGEPVCFVAVEMLADPPLSDVLLAHEGAHACHAQAAGSAWDGMTTLAQMLFVEGLAVVASRTVVPGMPDGTYLWPGRETTAGGGNIEAWIADCERLWPELRAALRRELDADGDDVLAAYFLGSASGRVPVRAGYFAGFRLVRALAERHPVAELAVWSPDRIQAEVSALLDAL